MTKRLQITVKDQEYREIKRLARARGMTIAGWVRQALDSARCNELVTDVKKKLDVVRVAGQYNYPAGDIESMLAEIQEG